MPRVLGVSAAGQTARAQACCESKSGYDQFVRIAASDEERHPWLSADDVRTPKRGGGATRASNAYF
jgi:hypothetical protein